MTIMRLSIKEVGITSAIVAVFAWLIWFFVSVYPKMSPSQKADFWEAMQEASEISNEMFNNFDD